MVFHLFSFSIGKGPKFLFIFHGISSDFSSFSYVFSDVEFPFFFGCGREITLGGFFVCLFVCLFGLFCLILLFSFSFFPQDPNDPSEKIFFLLPLFNSAIGGIIVGQVTAVVGGVWKGKREKKGGGRGGETNFSFYYFQGLL